ncbi:tRNA-dihydrouridine synthase family protein [Candidatus Woesearchaeota archaeon]|nr:tRNA-dihydrouridine synthase family protein [Candidatus Woesearchaeota archaeon]
MEKFTYMLAPIEDMTSNAFRAVCHKHGADLTFTELTRVESLARKNKSTWSRIELKDSTPTIIQLLGAKEFSFKKFLSMFSPSKGFKGFNLNFGCPSPQVVRIGQGCAMVRRISKAKKIVQIFRDYGYPVSIKMRLGITRIDKENKSYLNLINAVNADFFIVHARYGNQSYDEPADFSVYEECVKTGKTVIANGDITTNSQIEYLKKAGVKGAMIGRAAVLNPSIFSMLKGESSAPINSIIKEYLSLSDLYNEPFRYRKNIMKWIGKEGFGKTEG